MDVTHGLTQSTSYTKENDVIWREKFVKIFYDLGFEIIIKDTQEHWTLLFVEFVLFRYTILKTDIRAAVKNNKLY